MERIGKRDIKVEAEAWISSGEDGYAGEMKVLDFATDEKGSVLTLWRKDGLHFAGHEIRLKITNIDNPKIRGVHTVKFEALSKEKMVLAQENFSVEIRDCTCRDLTDSQGNGGCKARGPTGDFRCYVNEYSNCKDLHPLESPAADDVGLLSAVACGKCEDRSRYESESSCKANKNCSWSGSKFKKSSPSDCKRKDLCTESDLLNKKKEGCLCLHSNFQRSRICKFEETCNPNATPQQNICEGSCSDKKHQKSEADCLFGGSSCEWKAKLPKFRLKKKTWGKCIKKEQASDYPPILPAEVAAKQLSYNPHFAHPPPNSS